MQRFVLVTVRHRLLSQLVSRVPAQRRYTPHPHQTRQSHTFTLQLIRLALQPYLRDTAIGRWRAQTTRAPIPRS